MTKLTHAEHTARAMLLGRVYDWRDGSYAIPIDGYPSTREAIDCLTMEPFPEGVHAIRISSGYIHKGDWKKPLCNTPWGVMP